MKLFNKKLLILAIIIAILLISPYVLGHFYLGDDLFFHLSRIQGLKNTIIDKQVLAKIYPFKNFGFGYASPIFYCDLFLYLPAILLLLKVPLLTTYIVIIFIFIFLTTYTMGIAVFNVTKNEKMMLIAGTLYSLSPYHLFDIYQRASLGEIMSMAFIPLFLASIYYQVNLNGKKYQYLGISMALVLFSHNISFVLCVAYLFIYLILNYQLLNKKIILNIFKAGILALGLTAFFIFPMLEFFSGEDYFVNHIQDISNISSYALNPLSLINFVKPISITNLNLGLIISIGVIYQIVRKKYRKQAILVVALILVTTNLIPYNLLPFMTIIQFPFRFYVIATALAAFLAAEFYAKFYYKIGIFMICLVFLITGFEIKAMVSEMNFTKPNFVYEDILTNTYGRAISDDYGYTSLELINAEYLPYSTVLNYDKFQNVARYDNFDQVDAILIKDFTKLKINIINGYPNLNVLLPISYYKGYHLYKCDSNYQPLQEQTVFKGEYYPLVSFKLDDNPEGYYLLRYEATLIQKVTLFVSLVSFIYVIYLFLKKEQHLK